MPSLSKAIGIELCDLLLRNHISEYRFIERGAVIPDDTFFIHVGNESSNAKDYIITISNIENNNWVIRHSGDRLRKSTCNFEYQGLNSGRTDEYKADTQFDSAEEAFLFLKNACDKAGATLS